MYVHACILCEMSLQSLLSQYVSPAIFSQQERINKFYQGMFQHEKGLSTSLLIGTNYLLLFVLVHMQFIVCVGADYPNTPPAFAIKIEDSGEVQEIQIKVHLLLNRQNGHEISLSP